MKLVAYILSIYVLLLAVIPCQCKDEVYAHQSHSEVVVEFHASDNSQDGMQKSLAGLCSPFCTDATVHSFTLYTFNHSITLPRPVAITAKPQAVYREAVPQQTYARGVWRPPIA